MGKKTFAILCTVLGTLAGIIAIIDVVMIVFYFKGFSDLGKTDEISDKLNQNIEVTDKLIPDSYENTYDIEEALEEEAAGEETVDEVIDEPEVPQRHKRVVCWGDSLTEGTKGKDWSYPKGIKDAALNSQLEIDVLNYGVYAEESSLICARSGGNPMILDESVTIPGDSQKEVPIKLVSKMRGAEMLLVFGGAKDLSARGEAFKGDESINPCRFIGEDGNEIEGILRCDPDNGTKYFRRTESVDADVRVKSGQPVDFKAMYDSRASDILVIWTGNNDSLNKSNVNKNTIRYINEIIRYTYFGPDSDKTIEAAADKPYLVLNLSQIDQVNDIDDVNEQLEQAYPGHVLDIRSFLLCDALFEVGLKGPDEADKERIRNRDYENLVLEGLAEGDIENLKNGKMPASLYASDGVHFTPECYKAVGYRIFKELNEKGYFEE